MFKKSQMQYRRVGNSGLQISAISYGNFNSHEVIPFKQQVAIIKKCLENGINYFDTSENYTAGKDQQDLGKVLKQIKQPRERYVIGTKIWAAPEASINSNSGTSRKHIKQSLKASLKRLQLEYVDIVYAHSFDENSQIQQIVRGFNQLIEEGLAFYWGTSNWDSDRVFAAIQIAQKLGLHKPIACENQYNMLIREEGEKEYRTLWESGQCRLIGYSPLAGGFLSGKYLEGEGEGQKQKGRLSEQKTGTLENHQATFRWLHGVNVQKATQSLKQLKIIAQKQLNCDLTALAIAWAAKFEYSATALFGARDVEQLQGSLKAIQVMKKLNPQIEGRINKILGTQPDQRMDFKPFAPQPHLRPYIQ